jgi:LysR family transcriptional regulator (chromosome initiation inhibitor)
LNCYCVLEIASNKINNIYLTLEQLIMKFDYKLLDALSAVMAQQSFEQAAVKLFITQSAVSQRIKLLEETIGQPVIVRSQPIAVTAAGEKLLRHYKMVQQLENELLPDLLPDAPTKPIKVSLAVNADSVATWFLDAIAPVLKENLVELDLIIRSEGRTIDMLKTGEAIGAVTTHSKPLPGYQSFKLGSLEFILVASPEFKQRYFATGITEQSLRHAPGISYDPNDDMHVRFIAQHFKIEARDYYCHSVRSSQAFVDLAKKGVAYCLIPTLQIKDQLASGELINLCPDKSLISTLYWHSWVLVNGINKTLSQQIVRHGQQALIQP